MLTWLSYALLCSSGFHIWTAIFTVSHFVLSSPNCSILHHTSICWCKQNKSCRPQTSRFCFQLKFCLQSLHISMQLLTVITGQVTMRHDMITSILLVQNREEFFRLIIPLVAFRLLEMNSMTEDSNVPPQRKTISRIVSCIPSLGYGLNIETLHPTFTQL